MPINGRGQTAESAASSFNMSLQFETLFAFLHIPNRPQIITATTINACLTRTPTYLSRISITKDNEESTTQTPHHLRPATDAGAEFPCLRLRFPSAGRWPGA